MLCFVRVMLSVLLATSGSVSSALAQQPEDDDPKKPFALTTTFSSEFFVVDWSGTRGTNTFAPERGKGSQVYAPQNLAIRAEWANLLKWEATAKFGYVHSNHRTPLQEATLSTVTDTQIGNKWTFLSNAAFQPFVGVTANLPSGQAYLPGPKRFTRMDSDLVELGSYGQGVTVTPTTGASFALTSWLVVTPSVGYTFNSSFVREGVVPNSDLYNARLTVDPGDSSVATLNLSAKGTKWESDFSTTFKSVRPTRRDGIAVDKSGDSYDINANFNYAFTDSISLKLDGSWSQSKKNQELFRGALITEPKNSNSHLFVGTVQPHYKINAKTDVHIGYSILYRDNNFYDVVEEKYSPAKIKQTLGAGVDYAVNDRMSLGLNVHRFWVKEQAGASVLTATNIPADPFIDPANPASASMSQLPPTLEYSGWNISTALKSKF
jgi:outer membrane protein W